MILHQEVVRTLHDQDVFRMPHREVFKMTPGLFTKSHHNIFRSVHDTNSGSYASRTYSEGYIRPSSGHFIRNCLSPRRH